MNTMKRQKDRTLTDEFPRLVDAQYDTGDQWRNKKELSDSAKEKQYPFVDLTGDTKL